MILTRCPECGTMFRVRPEQLEARAGRVRCGQCQHAFNALDARIADDAPPPDVPPPAPVDAAPLFILEEKPAAAADDDTPPAAATTEALPPDSADTPPDDDIATTDQAVPPTDDAPPAEPTFEIDIDAPEDWPGVDIDSTAAAPAFAPDWPAAADLDLHTSATTTGAAVDFDALLHKQDAGSLPAALATAPDAQPWPASEEPAAMLSLPRSGPPPVSGAVTADTGEPAGVRAEESDDDTDTEEAASADDAAPAFRQAAWAAGATLLALALLAQGVLVFRGDIVRASPQLRPFMESLCAGLGCELPLPRDASTIAIESSDIQPDAGREAFFTLHATLRNRADYAQAYPHLEITLTDARDKALVRKVLEPVDWLPADAARDAFPAQRELSTRINFEAPGVAAAGYRVYVFYP